MGYLNGMDKGRTIIKVMGGVGHLYDFFLLPEIGIANTFKTCTNYFPVCMNFFLVSPPQPHHVSNGPSLSSPRKDANELR